MSESYPKQADRFKKWSEAMLKGATVGKPSYSKNSSKSRRYFPHKRRRRKGRRRRKVLTGE